MSWKPQWGVRLSLVVTVALAAGLTQGCAPPWKIVRSSGPPSALKEAQEVLIAFDYSQLRVSSLSGVEMGEQEWVATKVQAEPKYAETWADLKRRFEQGVVEGAQGRVSGAPSIRPMGARSATTPGTVVLQVQLRRFKLGQFVPLVLPPTVLSAELSWLTGGQVTDEILVERAAGHDIFTPSVFSVIGGLSRSVGDAGGAYLQAMRQ